MAEQKQSANIDDDPRAAVRGKISKLTFIEARRLKGPIYDVLVAELNEAGCPYSARKLRELADKEIDMIQKGITRESVCSNKNLLLSLFNNAKSAEISALLPECGGLTATFRLMFQMLLMLDPYKEKYEWMVEDLYEIISHICDKYDEIGNHGASELIARIYFQYGGLLSQKAENIHKAIQKYECAAKLSRGEAWPHSLYTNDLSKGGDTLHKAICLDLTKLLLKYAKMLVRNHPTLSAEMAQKAKSQIAEAGLTQNHLTYCGICISHGVFLMEAGDFEDALGVFQKVEEDIAKRLTFDYCKLKASLFLNMGICLTNLNDLEKAKKLLQKALHLNRVYGLKQREAETQMNLGKLFSYKQDLKLAKNAYEAAKTLFSELNNIGQSKTIVYLLAKLKADEIFPTFMDMVKSTDNHYCAFYNLRQWKNQCRPFWSNLFEQLERQKTTEVHCLLEKQEIPNI